MEYSDNHLNLLQLALLLRRSGYDELALKVEKILPPDLVNYRHGSFERLAREVNRLRNETREFELSSLGFLSKSAELDFYDGIISDLEELQESGFSSTELSSERDLEKKIKSKPHTIQRKLNLVVDEFEPDESKIERIGIKAKLCGSDFPYAIVDVVLNDKQCTPTSYVGSYTRAEKEAIKKTLSDPDSLVQTAFNHSRKLPISLDGSTPMLIVPLNENPVEKGNLSDSDRKELLELLRVRNG